MGLGITRQDWDRGRQKVLMSAERRRGAESRKQPRVCLLSMWAAGPNQPQSASSLPPSRSRCLWCRPSLWNPLETHLL